MRLGILTKSLGTSQPGILMTSQLNALQALVPSLEVVVFYKEYDRIPIKPEFAMMQYRYAYDYDNSTIISVDNESSHLLASIPAKARKYIYLWNLEWLYADMPFAYFSAILQHDNMQLIARSKSHHDVITKLWKEPSFIIEDFNHVNIASLCQ